MAIGLYKGYEMHFVTIPGMGGVRGIITVCCGGFKGMLFPINGEDFFVNYNWGESGGKLCMPEISLIWENFAMIPIIEPDYASDDFEISAIKAILKGIGDFDVETEIRFNKVTRSK